MQKRLFLTVGPTSSCNHLAARILVRMGCWGDYEALSEKTKKQIALDWTAIHGKEPPDEPLCVLWRSIGYNGTYPDLVKLKQNFEKYDYEVRTIFLERDWSSMIRSAAFRHKRWNWKETFERTHFEVAHIRKYMSMMEPFFTLNTSLLFRYPREVMALLEQFTELTFPEEHYSEIFNADEKWVYDSGEWQVFAGTIKVPNISRMYAGIPWNASAGSINCGAIIPGICMAIGAETAIEIGIANGFSTHALARGLSGSAGSEGFLISCDINENCCNIAKVASKDLPIKHLVIRRDSAKVDWKKYLNGKMADIAYVDGDHSYEAAKIDIEKCAEVVKPGGFMLCHDCAPGMPGVVRAVNELLETGKWSYVILPEIGKLAYYQAALLQKNSS